MNNNYTIAQRNALVEKHLWCIDTVIRKNRPLMRAAQTTLRRPALLLPRRAERPRRECAETAHSGAVWLFGTMFLAGYLPGIWLGRGGVSALGQQLAAYYTKSPENAAFAAIFGTEFSVSFLQLTAVFLCGFCVLGVGLLALLFAARGVFLGYCAASVAAVNGAAGLVQYFRGRHLVVVNKGQVGSNVGADLTIDGPIGQVFSQL